MHLFRVRLILALIAGVTLISAASTYFDVLAHKHTLRVELTRRVQWMGMSIERDISGVLGSSDISAIHGLTDILKSGTGAMALAVYDGDGKLLTCSGPADVLENLPYGLVKKTMKNGAEASQFGHTGRWEWLESAFPLHVGDRLEGVLVIVADAGYIRSEGIGVWQRSFWRIVALVVLIVFVTLGMVSWFLSRPIKQVAEHLRRLRLKGMHPSKASAQSLPGLSLSDMKLFKPIAREVETIAESLIAARAAAATEARLRDAGDRVWTAERLAVHMRRHSGSSSIFVVSNREPYIHVRQGREIKCVIPPSGLVTAIEPILQACDGVWVASGSGNADAVTVDSFNRLRVPPDDPRYTLRRVWLTEEEESHYYDGFANEGLWPLCHIAHTRPIFRAADWECYQRVNARFADALLEEMEGVTEPIVFVQDYHFALLPRLVKTMRPDARVAIFWHIPWPNPEAFGICPWQNELLDGLLGADLVGFHIPMHCSNFLASVDRALEARTDREHMTVLRNGHPTAVRPYPISVAFDGPLHEVEEMTPAEVKMEDEKIGSQRDLLLKEFGVTAKTILLGVDRMDYTKGILERLSAIEYLFEEHPWYRERVTMVQIAAPSRTRIASYAELGNHVEEMVEKINRRFQTNHWKPIILIDRHANHEEVNRWYRVADVCVVTSLHDGMNLVAKEYVASREDERGVLVLSKFAGAAVELQDALVVNPYDTEGVAEAIHQALEMNRGEVRQRMRRLRRQVMEHNIYRWAAKVLGDLREVRIEQPDAASENNHETSVSIPA